MHEVKFTKGPWVAEKERDGSFCITGKGGHVKPDYYVICSRGKHSLTEETHANASLISAAPELYEALSGMIEVYGGEIEADGLPKHSVEIALIREARAALSKARGEQC